jgi:hypothetical protein
MSDEPDIAPSAAPARPGHVVDSEGAQHRFAPFRHGPAPVSDQPAVRAAIAEAARLAAAVPDRFERPIAWSELRKVAPALSAGDPVWRFGPFAAAAIGGLAAGALAFVSASAGNRRAFAVPELGDIAVAVLVALVAYFLAIALLRARRRANSVAEALLAIGRCAACGFPLRGVAGEGAAQRCRCSECGAAWPADAANRPRRSDTGARAELPETDGIGAMRTRLALAIALRATGFDFFPDGEGRLRYIARMASAPVSDARAALSALAAVAFLEIPAVLAALLATLLVFPGCVGCIAGVVFSTLLGARDSDDPSAIGLEVALFGAILGLVAVLLARAFRGYLLRTRRLAQIRRHLRAGVCPCCTMDLPAAHERPSTCAVQMRVATDQVFELPAARELLSTCGCCGAAWRGVGGR